jgi:hypothetical protein
VLNLFFKNTHLLEHLEQCPTLMSSPVRIHPLREMSLTITLQMVCH